MTVYHFTGAVAYDRLGSSWRTAAGLRSVSVTDPTTGLLPTNLTQGGVAVTWLTADANSRYSFSCDVPGVVVDFGAGAEALYANEVPGMAIAAGGATNTAIDARMKWAPTTAYTLNQQVISPAGDVVKANTAHTSAGAYATDVAKWVLSTTFGTTAVVNVKDYGAKGDGTTDDTAAIQAAITATGWPTNRAKVIFPAGDYQVTGSISINGGGATSTPHLVLEGHGARLKTATASNTIIAVTNSVISLTRIHFVGLFFLVNAAGAIGVSLNNAELCTFQRCGFLGSFATGIKITGTSTYNTVTNCEFGSLSRGIEIAGGCDYLSVDVCHFNEQLAGTPLNWIGQTVATAQSGIKITGNTFYGTGATLPVVYLTNASTCQISDNAFDRCPLGGIFFGTGGSADANLISANTFIRTGNADDIKINGGNRCVVSANVFGVRQSVTAGTYSNIRIADPFSTAQGSGNAVTGNTSASTAAELHSMIRFDAGCLNNAITGNVGRAIIVAAGAGTALTGNITA